MVLHDWRTQSLLVSRIRRLAPVFDGGARVNRLPRRAFGSALVAGVGERFEHPGVPGRNADVLGRTAGNEIAVSLSFCARALRGSFGCCRSTLSPLLNAPANHSPHLRRTGGTRSRRGMSAICAEQTAGVDVRRASRIVTVDTAVGERLLYGASMGASLCCQAVSTFGAQDSSIR